MPTKTRSIRDRHALDVRVAEGWDKHGQEAGGMVVDRRRRGVDEIAEDLHRRAAAEEEVRRARAALDGAIRARERVAKETQAVFDAVCSTARFAWSSSPEVLADFGLEPKKTPRRLTLEEKTDAVAKAQRTRELRHVMGCRQRLRIRAVVSPPPEAAASCGDVPGAATRVE